MSRPAPLKLGPFTGGLNTASDPSAIADNELVECVNFELDLDGSLASRPPIVETTNNSSVWTERIVMIGRANIAGGFYLIGSNVNGTYAFDGTTWTTIKSGLQSRVAIQYQDYVFIVAQTGSAQNGGYWDGASFVTDANMPKGEAAVFHKSRMFIVPGILATGAGAHQLRYTDPISVGAPVPLSWTSTNKIDVSQGDGQKLVDVVQFNDNLLLFKQDSTYALVYDLSITDSVLRKVNNDIGATTRRCVVTYENSVFVMHEGSIFEIQNYDFRPVNVKTPFALDATKPTGTTRSEEVFLCMMGNRMVARYFNKVYTFQMRAGTWATWESASEVLQNFGYLVEFPTTPVAQAPLRFFAGSSIQEHENVFVITDGTTNAVERTIATQYDISAHLLTKNYDFDDPMNFKKLKWWGADVLCVNQVIGVATPIVLNFRVTWNELSTYTWNQMLNFTWDHPLATLAAIETDVNDDSVFLRKFMKFRKTLRFRLINYRLTLTTDGSSAEGPARVFSLTAIVGAKETLVRQVS